MQQNRDRFDDRMISERGVALAGLPGDGDSAKVRTGQVGESRQLLGAAVIDELDEVWRKRITVPLGFADYAELIAALEAVE
tara:strand:- start:25071 stop:25313 length:243 start_codon:yes stop_codon:yes gene_type:complete